MKNIIFRYKTYEKLYVEAVDAKVLLSFDRDNYRINLHGNKLKFIIIFLIEFVFVIF